MFDLSLIIVLTIVGKVVEVGAQAVDGTLTEKTSGGAVVWATLHKIRKASIFPDDHLFIDRVGWVESSFGNNVATFQRANIKGIWQLSNEKFDKIKMSNDSNLLIIIAKLKEKFEIDWSQVTFDNKYMNTPFYNAIAAWLYILSLEEPIPLQEEAQAIFWKNYYTSLGKGGGKFLEAITSIPQCRSLGNDVLFILDGSNSIKPAEFQLIKQFVGEIIKEFPLGPDDFQVAILVFSNLVQKVMEFTGKIDISTVLSKIDAITHPAKSTATDKALDMVAQMFSTARNLAEGYPRIVIILTDGESDDPDRTKLALKTSQNSLARNICDWNGQLRVAR